MCQRQILIVDDDRVILEMLQVFIHHQCPDYKVVTAGNGTMALAELQQQTFDLILTDYDMPRMNGMDLAQIVHQIFPDMPIFLMTAHHDSLSELKTEAVTTTLAGFLRKPFEFTKLREILQINGKDYEFSLV